VCNVLLPNPSERIGLLKRSRVSTHLEKARGILLDWEEPIREVTLDQQDLSAMLDARVSRLSVLGPILEDHVPDCIDVEEPCPAALLEDRSAHQYYSYRIGRKFPHADASLVEMYGKCNWARYNHIQKQREENAARETSPIPSGVGDGEIRSKYHDSGLGSSLPAQSAYTGTVISHRAGLAHIVLPQLPEEGKKGKPFVCEVCNKAVTIQRTPSWKYVSYRSDNWCFSYTNAY
jgi:hypothetical protein